jgi:hypothetical protein
VTVLTFIKYLSSLLATVALYLALSGFSRVLRPGAIVLACFVWIASSLHAPFRPSTSLSMFTFAIMLFGIDCILLCRRRQGVFGFCLFGALAASLRPEYFLPLAFMILIWLGGALRTGCGKITSRFGWPLYGVYGGAACFALAGGALLCAHPPAALREKAKALDHYALFAFGQCYAEFYRGEHPQEVFSSMTEYRGLIDKTFHHPTSFVAAVSNNTFEAMRYFTLNAGLNLVRDLPHALLGRFREETAAPHRGVLYWMMRVLLLCGALAGVARWRRAGWKGRRADGQNSLRRRFFLLGLLLIPSAVALVLVIGTPRYYLGCVPLFYLGVAYCADSLLGLLKDPDYEPLLVGLAFIFLCAPNFLMPRPNYEFDAVRLVASRVKQFPVVAALWAEPDTVIALYGKARPLNISDGIHRADIENKEVDILLVNEGFRKTKTWTDDREFFVNFERRPEGCGFTKARGIPAGDFDIYYRPNPQRH